MRVMSVFGSWIWTKNGIFFFMAVRNRHWPDPGPTKPSPQHSVRQNVCHSWVNQPRFSSNRSQQVSGSLFSFHKINEPRYFLGSSIVHTTLPNCWEMGWCELLAWIFKSNFQCHIRPYLEKSFGKNEIRWLMVDIKIRTSEDVRDSKKS